MKFQVEKQYIQALEELLALARKYFDEKGGVHFQPNKLPYTSLMICFFMQNMSASESLLRLYKSFSSEWFPQSIGYAIVRTMFEVDVTAHYISKRPDERALRYIDYGDVLNKQQMDVYKKYLNSNEEFGGYVALRWDKHWKERESEIENKYKQVQGQFAKQGKKGKIKHWSGKNLYDMACEVDHSMVYEIFYSELSSFIHADVKLADCFLQSRDDNFVWSQKASGYHVANVFQHAVVYLECIMNLFAREFELWSEQDIHAIVSKISK